jgi:hypothetical protein
MPTGDRIRKCSRILGEDLFHPAHHSAYQAHFDSVRMRGGMGENILNDPLRQFSGTLILFPYHFDLRSRFNVRSGSSVHLHLLQQTQLTGYDRNLQQGGAVIYLTHKLKGGKPFFRS